MIIQPYIDYDRLYNITFKGLKCLLDYCISIDISYFNEVTSANNNKDKLDIFFNNSFIGTYYAKRRTLPEYITIAIDRRIIYNNLKNKLTDMQSEESILLYNALDSYLSNIEIHDPFVLIGNCLNYIDNKRIEFDSLIYRNCHSACNKFNIVKQLLKKIDIENDEILKRKTKSIDEFRILIDDLEYIFDSNLRNAIAHSSYKIDTKNRLFTYHGNKDIPYSCEFEEIHKKYKSAYFYLMGFIKAVTDFADKLIPNCAYVIRW